jgi:hypothetical protein
MTSRSPPDSRYCHSQRLSACVRAAALGVMLASIALSSVPDYVRSALLAPATRTRNPAAIVYRHGAVDFRLNLRIPAEVLSCCV